MNKLFVKQIIAAAAAVVVVVVVPNKEMDIKMDKIHTFILTFIIIIIIDAIFFLL